jgi:hypothetical protein
LVRTATRSCPGIAALYTFSRQSFLLLFML